MQYSSHSSTVKICKIERQNHQNFHVNPFSQLSPKFCVAQLFFLVLTPLLPSSYVPERLNFSDYEPFELISIVSFTYHNIFYTHKCNRTVALRAFYNQVIPGPVKIAMIGSGCSVATAPTAENSPYYNITHVSSSVVILFLQSGKFWDNYIICIPCFTVSYLVQAEETVE